MTNPADPRIVWKGEETGIVRVPRQLLREIAGLVLLIAGGAGVVISTFAFDVRLGWACLSAAALAVGVRLSRSS